MGCRVQEALRKKSLIFKLCPYCSEVFSMLTLFSAGRREQGHFKFLVSKLYVLYKALFVFFTRFSLNTPDLLQYSIALCVY